jgi:hypothetical protein
MNPFGIFRIDLQLQLSFLPKVGFPANFKFVLEHEQVKESKRLVKCFLNYLKHDKAEVNVLFEMLSIFLVRTRIDYTFLKEFFMVEVRNYCNLHLIYFKSLLH